MVGYEIEIQVRVENSEALLRFLEKNAKFESENQQIDEYYTPAHRDFLKSNPINEWLRIRDSRGKFSITYKNYKQYDEHGKSNFCDEYETKIENLDAFRKILHSLDFRLLTKVNKLRKIWNYKDYEISIDSVKNLGDFVEIEYKGNDDNPDTKRIVSEMVNFLKSAGCGKVEINHQGYPYLLMFPEKANYEAV